jgi:hypothetical protein
MIASPYVAGLIYDTLAALPAVTDVVGDRIDRRFLALVNPDDYKEPFIVYRQTEPGFSDAPMGRSTTDMTLRFEVAAYIEGRAVAPIVPVAEAFDEAIQAIDHTVPGKGWQITAIQETELPDLDIEFGLPYVRVGSIYAFTVTQ